MNFFKQNKLMVIISVVLVCGVFYYIFKGGSSASPALLSSDTQAPTAESQQLLVVLANLKTIQLNGAIFTDPVFLSLTDFGVVISPETVGRRNPFVPFTAIGGNGKLSVPGQ